MTGQTWPITATAQSPAGDQCGSSRARLRTTLYFGTSKPKGAVSELEWQMFLRDDVTKRFPDGLTVWNAEGQWKAGTGAIERLWRSTARCRRWCGGRMCTRIGDAASA